MDERVVVVAVAAAGRPAVEVGVEVLVDREVTVVVAEVAGLGRAGEAIGVPIVAVAGAGREPVPVRVERFVGGAGTVLVHAVAALEGPRVPLGVEVVAVLPTRRPRLAVLVGVEAPVVVGGRPEHRLDLDRAAPDQQRPPRDHGALRAKAGASVASRSARAGQVAAFANNAHPSIRSAR